MEQARSKGDFSVDFFGPVLARIEEQLKPLWIVYVANHPDFQQPARTLSKVHKKKSKRNDGTSAEKLVSISLSMFNLKSSLILCVELFSFNIR